MKEFKRYLLGDRHPSQKIGPGHIFDGDVTIQAISTGVRRPPSKGEWYLSGCEGYVRAYRAPNDLSDSELIARIVRVETKTVTTTRIIESIGN